MCAPSQSAMLPYNLKIPSPYFPFGPSSGGINQAHLSALDFQRSQLNDYNVRVQLGLRNYQNSLGLPPFHSYITDPYSQAFFYKHDPRARFVQEEPKPSHSYIGLIAMAILSSKEKKLVLSDIYQWILDNYPYFRSRGPGWRNSIRHNLSLNDCFIKSGRSANGKGHYWAVHPANVEDFERGDFRRRRAQRKVRRHMGLSVPDDDDSPSPSPTQPWPLGVDADRPVLDPARSHEEHKRLDLHAPQVEGLLLPHATPVFLPGLRKPSKRRLFDMASLLAPDDDDDDAISRKMQREDTPGTLKRPCLGNERECSEQRCFDSRCVSPHGDQECRSPCSRSGGCCASDDDDNDDDNEEIEVASRPSSPLIDLKESDHCTGENVKTGPRLSAGVEDKVVQNLSLSSQKLSSHISNGALDLSSPNSAELLGRSSYSSRSGLSINLPRTPLGVSSPTNNTQVNSEDLQVMSSPVGNIKSHGSIELSRQFDSPEGRVLRDPNTLTNGESFEERANLGFMPPTSRMDFDIAKLNSESMHYFRMQLQGGNKRSMDPRFDFKLGLSDMAASFPGMDPKNAPDLTRLNPTCPVEGHQMGSPEALRLASLGVRWTPPGLLRGNLPTRDNLGMFTSFGARPPGMYSPFQTVNFPLQSQRGMPALNPLRCSLPSTLLPMAPAPSSTSPSSSASPPSLSLATVSASTAAEAPVVNSSSSPPVSPQGLSPVANVTTTTSSNGISFNSNTTTTVTTNTSIQVNN